MPLVLHVGETIQGGRARSDLELLADALSGGLVASSLDPDTTSRLLTLSIHHGVIGLFPLNDARFVPALAATRARALRALKFTRRVVAAIESAGIAVAVLKGAGAASRWPDPSLRQQSDVDVLVDRGTKDAAADALVQAGVCKVRFITSDQLHNDSLEPADPAGLLVEVHHYFNNHHRTQVETKELLQRRTRVRTAQGDLPVLAAEDDAVYLALHATTHALQRLAWLVDLSVLSPDWSEAANRARAWGIGPAVAPAWHRTRALLGTPIPESAFACLGVPRWQADLSKWTLAAAERSRGSFHQFFERLFRLSVVPPKSLPYVIVQKARGRWEEAQGYRSRQ
jgi:hypothetical protein